MEEGEGLSPTELADFTGQPLGKVAFHVRALRDHGAVELIRERRARGAVEHFYAATELVDAAPWARGALGLQPEQRGNDKEVEHPTTSEEDFPEI